MPFRLLLFKSLLDKIDFSVHLGSIMLFKIYCDRMPNTEWMSFYFDQIMMSRSQNLGRDESVSPKTLIVNH